MQWCAVSHRLNFICDSSFRSEGESTEKVSYFICYFLWVLGEWDTNKTLPTQLAATYSELVFFSYREKQEGFKAVATFEV